MTTTTETRPITPPPSPEWRPGPPRRSAATVTVGLALVAVGVLALLATIGVQLPLTVLGPAFLIALGVGVLVSAVRGEPAGGVIALAVAIGLILALVAVAGALLDVPLRGGVGERHHRPIVTTELDDEYRLLVGRLVVDLRDVELRPGTTEVDASAVLGEVVVRVPDDVAVAVDSSVGGGATTVLGVTEEGLSVDNDHRSQDWTAADRRLLLRVGVGLGEVQVTR